MLQQWIAGIMVTFAAAYALWYWMPAGLRRRLGRVQKRLGKKPGCGACASCGGCGAAAKLAAVTTGLSERQPLWIKPHR